MTANEHSSFWIPWYKSISFVLGNNRALGYAWDTYIADAAFSYTHNVNCCRIASSMFSIGEIGVFCMTKNDAKLAVYALLINKAHSANELENNLDAGVVGLN